MYTERLLALRQQKDHFFKNHPQSPLTDAQKDTFDGLSYFAPNPDLNLHVDVKPFDHKDDIAFQTNTGDTRWYRRYGEFTFKINGTTARLTVYATPHGYFLPFTDAGAGETTYSAGRYLEPVHEEGDTFQIDLNQAYNPYCAYNGGWVCPITPPENRLEVPIPAGEKLPEGDWVDAS